MEDFGLRQLCVDLCKNIINSQVSDGSEIKYLLPVKYIISNWSMYDSVEWKNPITGEEYVEPFSSESTRVQAIQKINKRIDDYNAEVEKLDSEYDDLEERVKNQQFRQRTHYEIWSLTAWMHKPVHKRKSPTNNWQKTPFDARHFNSEPVFNRIMACTTEEEAVGKFNKMLFDYIEAATGGKQLIETSTFYYPKLEFEDFMMRSGCAEFINLLEEDRLGDVESIPSPFESMFPVNNYPSVEAQQRRSTYKVRPPPEAKPEEYRLTIDLENQTITAKDKARDNIKDVTATFKECGLSRGDKPNRFMMLLIKYAYFQELTKDKPFFDKAMEWNVYVVGETKANTFSKYHKGLKEALILLLDIQETMHEDGTFTCYDIFIKKTETTQRRNTKGDIETVKESYYECLIDLQIKQSPEGLRETGMYKDGIDQWSSDIDVDTGEVVK